MTSHGARRRLDTSRGVACEPVLELVVERSIDTSPLPAHLPVGRVLSIGVTPFWIGFNSGCIPDRPNDLVLDGVGLSRNSCWFVLVRGTWYGNDARGTTALVVDGVVARGTPIRTGSVVDVGRVRCRARIVVRSQAGVDASSASTSSNAKLGHG